LLAGVWASGGHAGRAEGGQAWALLRVRLLARILRMAAELPLTRGECAGRASGETGDPEARQRPASSRTTRKDFW
jgi:hypothetical protein